MRELGFSTRFWLFLLVALAFGLLTLDLAMRIGARVGLIPTPGAATALTLLRVVWTVVALGIAVAVGSAVWTLLYRASECALLAADARLTLADFGRRKAADEKPYWARSRAANAGTLREFLRLGDDPEFRIGIVLAGGGAKGVYQAGALRALWEFLEANDAFQYVRMIAGTSIGSWNAMFWLTGQLAAGPWDQGALYDWWTSARLSTVVNPIVYVPIACNYLAGNRVWRGQFTELFSNKAPGPFPYFYFTRTNVESALLDFTTNRREPPGLVRGTLPNYRSLANKNRSLDMPLGTREIEAAVFASMDIPPAFRRLRDVTGIRYEDGGVIDNLPIQFATWCEGCNLLFVFPLNATFAARASDLSILARMARVLDVRQGVLERGALTDISLYNRIIECQTAAAPEKKLRGVHAYPTTTFCICPGPELEVGTFGFWSLKRRGRECYRLMYEATRTELAKFDFSTGNREVWMAKVNPGGDIKYEDFTLR